LWDVMSTQLGDLAGDLSAQQDRLGRYSPQAQVAQWRQRVDTLAETARLHLGHTLTLDRARLATRQAELAALSPAAISARGYAVVRNRRTGAVLRRAADAAPGDLLEIHLQDGIVPAQVSPPPRK